MKTILLSKRPNGFPDEQTFEIKEVDKPEKTEQELIIKLLYVSVDPYMRGRMSDKKSYIDPFEVGEAITGGVVGQVISSSTDQVKEGDVVTGHLPFTEYVECDAKDVRRVETHGLDPKIALGTLGMPGLTAYMGITKIAKPKQGETVVISAAAGAVGSVAGQLALQEGARVIGLVGSDDKAAYITEELGFTEAINYHHDLQKSLEEACPDGIDVYFENVGGTISDQVWPMLNTFARVPVCGSISSYNLEENEKDIGPRVQQYLVKSRIHMQGFLVGDYKKSYKEAYVHLAKMLEQGKLKQKDTVLDGGIEKVPEAFSALFTGKNIGKQLVKIT